MRIKEEDIMYENTHAWILKTPQGYEVCLHGLCYSVIDSMYSSDQDGLSIAMARCDYIAKTYADIPVHSQEWSERSRRIVAFDNDPVPKVGVNGVTTKSFHHPHPSKYG